MLQSLRSKVFAFLSFLMLVSLAGVGVSFSITQRVNQRLTEINHRSVPMQRELTRLASDTELLGRELDRSLGFSHWKDPRWKPRRIPHWALEVHRSTLDRVKPEYLHSPLWKEWHQRLLRLNERLTTLAESLYLELQEQRIEKAGDLYPEWLKTIEMLEKEVAWAKREIDNETREVFQEAQAHVQDLRSALRILVLVVIASALTMIWMGERALRPIAHLREIVRRIVDRGSLDEHTRAGIPSTSLHQTDEVSALAREFHQMATTLIEREKMIEYQKARLEEQNKTLMEMGELERRLQQAEHLAAVGRMSAQVAHEVGNPLHSIGLEAEHALSVLASALVPAESPGSKHQIALRQSLQSIEGSVERLQKIIQNYLKLTRLTPGVKRSVDLKETIESSLATYATAFESLKVRVNWHFDPALREGARVIADPELLEFALGNLIRNSLQVLEKTPPGTRAISITLEPLDRGRVQLGFSDTGPGIPEEIRANLFKPFTTTKAQGTGLGLSFVKKVFTDLGGDFRLSRGHDRGAAFEGELPREDLTSHPGVETGA